MSGRGLERAVSTAARPALGHLSWGAPLMAAAATGCVCAVVWAGNPTVPGGPLPVCPTKLLFGIDCPGCGSLRMLYSLMHGDVLAAARFNALGLAAAVLLTWAYVAWTVGRVTRRRMWSWQNHRWSAHVTLLLVLGWFVVRNLPFGPFPALRV